MASSSRKPPSNIEAAITSRAQRVQIKTLKAKILSLNKELSDLKQKLEIRENNNKNLLEINQKTEKYLNDYIKVMGKALAAKDLIIYSKDLAISKLVKNHRNNASDLFFTNNLSTGDSNKINYNRNQINSNTDVDFNSLINNDYFNSIIKNNDYHNNYNYNLNDDNHIININEIDRNHNDSDSDNNKAE
ncbi:11839_t:CDS:2 [Ambispora gerdemannii]|uniref:11839_t:CDS:1 n=1 Tax=Ambispora gerdemannii TaxID=144530 RepID=A0A9N9FND4_9GLOM|nr:11839_t:CDS:2 [Ambispora gerdemannii]